MGPSEGPTDLVYQLERVALHVPIFLAALFWGVYLFTYLLRSTTIFPSFLFVSFFLVLYRPLALPKKILNVHKDQHKTGRTE